MQSPVMQYLYRFKTNHNMWSGFEQVGTRFRRRRRRPRQRACRQYKPRNNAQVAEESNPRRSLKQNKQALFENF